MTIRNRTTVCLLIKLCNICLKSPQLNKRWLYFTIVVGLIPIALRCLLWVFFIKDYQQKLILIISPNDLASFGLALNIANIIEVMDKGQLVDKEEKMGVSIVFLLFFAILFAISTIFELKDEAETWRKATLLGLLLLVTFPSVFYSHSIFRLTSVSSK